MKLFVLFFMTFSVLSTVKAKDPVDCQNVQNICEYYLCMAQERNCGEKSYYVSFGYKYCMKFSKAHERNFTPEGHNWLEKTRRCLIDKIDEISPDASCKQVKKIAFKQHITCYVESGFCDLKNKDVRKVMRIAKKQLYKYKSIKTGLKILNRCRKL